MKRIFRQVSVWLCCLCLLLLVGCASGKEEVQPVTKGFTCRMAIEYREMELDGQLTRFDNGKLQLAFDRPLSLSGITIGWDGENMTMELGGVSINVAEDKIPEGALVKGLLQVLAAEAVDGVESKEGYVFAGKVDGQAYTLVCDPTTGLPRSLSVPDNELHANFTEASLLTAEDAAA